MALKTAGRAVWVLIFDHLPQDFSRGLVNPGESEFSALADSAAFISVTEKAGEPGELVPGVTRSDSAFDSLELTAAFFEQFCVQDVRSRGAFPWGDEAAFTELRQQIMSGGKTAVFLRLSETETLTELMASVKPESPDLIWIDVSPGPESISAAERILAEVQTARGCGTDRTAVPALIVSARHGSVWPVKEPFETGLPESLCRVPLWIDTGRPYGSRLQTLAGSLDLLPTIADLLLEKTADVESRGGDGELHSAPRSLVSALQFGESGDRVLPLRGDRWTALRSNLYLLVLSESDTDSEPERRLYLKPDDFWNVNNMIVSCEAIADELQAVQS